MLRPRYIMLGGFLGAGKTTAMRALARKLTQRGLRVGAITNDQSVGLVDTQLLRADGYATEEIAGGCFCCQFNSLWEAAERLTASALPDVLLAEPVGSCTDLRATVADPLQQLYGQRVLVAPLSVLVDPIRAQHILGLTAGKRFTAKVNYIYEKQLEEADWIVVNKIDLLQDLELAALKDALRTRWPGKEVLPISLRENCGVDEWLDRAMSSEMLTHTPMEINYDVYAEGEARLGWLNMTARLFGHEFDGNEMLRALADGVRRRTEQGECEIAHFKATLIPGFGRDLAVVSAVRGNADAEMPHRLVEPLASGELTVNLRAEGAPELLSAVVRDALESAAAGTGIGFEIAHLHAFRPGRPVPVHRSAASS